MTIMHAAYVQVLGAHLRSLRGKEREQKMWYEALKMLRKAVKLPSGRDKLFASLRVSYDALGGDQQRMFLDAAFFLLNRRTDTALHAWEGYALKRTTSVLLFLLLHGYGPYGGTVTLWQTLGQHANMLHLLAQVRIFLARDRIPHTGQLLPGASHG